MGGNQWRPQNPAYFAAGAKMSDPEAEAEEVEIVMEEAVEVIPDESSDTNPAEESESPEDKLHRFGHSLELPLEVLEAVGETDQGKLLLQKVIDHLEEKDSQIEEYQSTLNDFMQSMSQQNGELEHLS